MHCMKNQIKAVKHEHIPKTSFSQNTMEVNSLNMENERPCSHANKESVRTSKTH